MNLEPEDWLDYEESSHRKVSEPFYAVAEPCESCGRPCESRTRAGWDHNLLVGPCCQFHIVDLPDVPVCLSLWEAVKRCTSVREVSMAFALHVSECAFCRGERKVVELDHERLEHKEAA